MQEHKARKVRDIVFLIKKEIESLVENTIFEKM
jgi:hypothetical protein